MAAAHLPSPPQPSSAPPSVSHSEATSTQPKNPLVLASPLPPLLSQAQLQPRLGNQESTQGENVPVNVTSDELEESKPDLKKCSEYVESEEELKKYQKYEEEFSQRLMAKYFSNQNIYGGDVYDLIVMAGTETLKISRWPMTRSYADPAKSFKEAHSSCTTSVAETPSNHANDGSPVNRSS